MGSTWSLLLLLILLAQFPIRFNVEVLQECLELFAAGSGAIATAERAPGYDDPDLQRRLRDLGYLED